MIGARSRLRLIRKTEALAKIKLTRDLSIEEKAARRKWKNSPLVDCESFKHRGPRKRNDVSTQLTSRSEVNIVTGTIHALLANSSVW